jgi:TPR repeat protein
MRRILICLLWLAALLPAQPAQTLVFDRTKLWPNGSVLRVCFFGGGIDLRKRIASVAKQWTADANIKFDFGLDDSRPCKPGQQNEVRVGFGSAGNWAFVGTDGASLGGSSSEVTVNFDHYDVSVPPEPQFTIAVLHEFGLVLGFALEHQGPITKCEDQFDWAAVYHILGMQGWSKDAVDRNLKAYSPDSYRQNTMDLNSVMMLEFPKQFFKDSRSPCAVVIVTGLSETDRREVASIYNYSDYQARSPTHSTTAYRSALYREGILRSDFWSLLPEVPIPIENKITFLRPDEQFFEELLERIIKRYRQEASGGLDAVFSELDSRNYESARTALSKLAPSDPRAALLLAYLNQRGLSVPKNWFTALMWVRTAAQRKDPSAQMLLGLSTLTGLGNTPVSVESGSHLLEEAARVVPEAAFLYGALLVKGVGTKKDPKSAFEFFSRSAEAKYEPGLVALGIMYDQGLAVAAPDPQKATALFKDAAAAGYGPGLYLFGLAEIDGNGVAADVSDGYRKIVDASEVGLIRAYATLGYLTKSGIGCEKDQKTALAFFEVAAAAGDPASQYEIGLALENGGAGHIDYDAALSRYENAAASGHEQALQKAAALRSRRDAPYYDPIKAYAWLTLASRPSFAASSMHEEVVENLRSLAEELADLKFAEALRLSAEYIDRREGRSERQNKEPPKDAETQLQARKPKPKSKGSGVIVSRSGVILTNRHVVQDCGSVSAEIEGAGTISTQKPIYFDNKEDFDADRDTDLALIQLLNFQPSHAIKLRQSSLRKGQPILVLGYPLSDYTKVGEFTVKAGLVEALTGYNSNRGLFVHSADVTFGNSGGPIVDMNGNLGGLVVSKVPIYVRKEDQEAKRQPDTEVRMGIKLDRIQELLETSGIEHDLADANVSPATETQEAVVDRIKREVVLLTCYER